MTKKLILVVEDDEFVQKAMRGLLKAYGYDVHTAGNYDDGLGMLQTQAYALIISDNQMPKHADGPTHRAAGLELLTYASQTDIQRGVPLLMYSGDGADTVADKLAYIGAHYLYKPSSAFIRTVQKLLKEKE